MKNDKILNFLIAMFITLIVFNFFMPTQKKVENKGGIFISSSATSYTIPNIPIIQVKNSTNNSLKIDTCSDLFIKKDNALILDINKSYKNFCTDLLILPNETKVIDLEPISKLFTYSGEYEFLLKKDKEYRVIVNQSEKGFFNNFFSTLFYAPVYNLFVYIIDVIPGHNLGLSIILVTILIRLLILVPQHKIMVNSRKMQAIQPKIKEIQEKYKGDQAKIGMELLELYKKEKVNPVGSCLPLMLQLPILIVLYWTISGITSSSNYYYLYSFLSDFDISKINTFFLGLNLVKQDWLSGLILAILIGFFQWLQIKMSLTFHDKKKSHGKIIEKDVKVDDPISEFMPDPNIMNNFMLWGMPIMLAISSYFFPSGVGIYWLIGTIFTLIQQYVVNKFFEDKKIKTPEGHEIILNKKK